MRTLVPAVVLSFALVTSLATAQAPGKQHCSIEPATTLTEADQAFLAGDAAKAESLWTAQLAKSPSLPAYAGLIRSQLQQDKVDLALESAKALIAAFPEAAEAYALSGDVLIRDGHIPEASDAFSKALSLDQ